MDVGFFSNMGEGDVDRRKSTVFPGPMYEVQCPGHKMSLTFSFNVIHYYHTPEMLYESR